MEQPSTDVPDLPTDVDNHVGGLPTIEFPARPASRSASGPHVGVRTRLRQVVVLDVAGRLRDVVEDLDRAIELALAEGPRGVVCDLAAVLEGAEPGAVEVLAGLGRHVRDWPGIPVAVACPDPQVREVLAAHRVGGHMIVTASLLSAVSAVLGGPGPHRGVATPHAAPDRASLRATSSRAPCWTGGWAGSFVSQARLSASS